MDTTAAVQSLIANLEGMLVSPYRELTLKQQEAITGISSPLLRRRWKFDPDWNDVVYVVGESGTDYRTTLDRINTCRERAAKRARELSAAKKGNRFTKK